jgi:hypothetical protein
MIEEFGRLLFLKLQVRLNAVSLVGTDQFTRHVEYVISMHNREKTVSVYPCNSNLILSRQIRDLSFPNRPSCITAPNR